MKSKSILPFASIPLLFGIQQIIEGIVWISFDASFIHSIATYLFVLFAYVLWPTFVPISIWLIEKNPIRKKILWGISLVGIVVSIYLFTFSVISPVTCSIVQDSIFYQVDVPYPLLSFLLYFFATCAGSMVSSFLRIQIFGTFVILSFFFAHWLYPVTLFSVWCFFSAVLSIIIYIHLKDSRTLIES